MPCVHRELPAQQRIPKRTRADSRSHAETRFAPTLFPPLFPPKPGSVPRERFPVRSVARLESPDTQNAARPKVRLRPTACPTGLESPMAKPKRARVGGSSPSSGTAPKPQRQRGLWRSRADLDIDTAELRHVAATATNRCVRPEAVGRCLALRGGARGATRTTGAPGRRTAIAPATGGDRAPVSADRSVVSIAAAPPSASGR